MVSGFHIPTPHQTTLRETSRQPKTGYHNISYHPPVCIRLSLPNSLEFLVQFFQLYPEFSANPFWITGEVSYNPLSSNVVMCIGVQKVQRVLQWGTGGTIVEDRGYYSGVQGVL